MNLTALTSHYALIISPLPINNVSVTPNHPLERARTAGLDRGLETLAFLIYLVRYIVSPAALINPLYTARIEIIRTYPCIMHPVVLESVYNSLFIAAKPGKSPARIRNGYITRLNDHFTPIIGAMKFQRSVFA